MKVLSTKKKLVKAPSWNIANINVKIATHSWPVCPYLRLSLLTPLVVDICSLYTMLWLILTGRLAFRSFCRKICSQNCIIFGKKYLIVERKIFDVVYKISEFSPV